MSSMVVITFDNEQDAGAVLQTIRGLEKQGVVKLNDTAVVSKDQAGEVHIKNEVSSATETGATVGAVVGGLLTFMFPPLGAAVGAAGGAAIGAVLQQGVDGSFVKEVSQSLEPGKSALFLEIGAGHPSAIDALKPYKGTVFQTTLDPDVEDRLRRALS